MLASVISAFRCVRTCSMVSLMKAFLPGNFSSGASKLPRPNSAIQAMAFFFTLMWPPTISLTPVAMVRYAPSNSSGGMMASMSPALCASDMRIMSVMNFFKLARNCSMFSLMKAFLPGNFSSGASKFPRPNSAMQAMAFFLTLMWPPTIWLIPEATSW